MVFQLSLCVGFGCYAALLGGSEEVVEPFQIHTMLKAAVAGIAEAIGKKTDSTLAADVEQLTEACIPVVKVTSWQNTFAKGVDAMMVKTKGSMQRGLSEVARSVTELVNGTYCGKVALLEELREAADRLRILAGESRMLADLDSKVRYEPLKSLTVGGVDIHLELNELIIAWQLKKGPEAIGGALAKFLARFHGDGGTEGDSARTPTVASGGGLVDRLATEDEPKRRSRFWSTALSAALERFGGRAGQVRQACLTDRESATYSQKLDESFASMMEKNRRGMQAGLQRIAKSTVSILESLGLVCSAEFGSSSSAKKLRNAASRLMALASAKTLINIGSNVDYEPLKILRVGGIDIHLKLNRFISGWLKDEPAEKLGTYIAEFLGDFQDDEADQESLANVEVKESLAPAMLRDAVAAAASVAPFEVNIPGDCFSDGVEIAAFIHELEEAIDHILLKRKRSMQLGLRGIADATIKLWRAMPSQCVSNLGSRIIEKGAKKLQALTRRMVVDYGTHIQYEAMKSLTVGKVAIHRELNAFLSAYKLRSRAESGQPFGELMRRLSTIEGHDEL